MNQVTHWIVGVVSSCHELHGEMLLVEFCFDALLVGHLIVVIFFVVKVIVVLTVITTQRMETSFILAIISSHMLHFNRNIP